MQYLTPWAYVAENRNENTEFSYFHCCMAPCNIRENRLLTGIEVQSEKTLSSKSVIKIMQCFQDISIFCSINFRLIFFKKCNGFFSLKIMQCFGQDILRIFQCFEEKTFRIKIFFSENAIFFKIVQSFNKTRSR